MKRTDSDHVDPEPVLGLSAFLRELSRYDLVLGLIPVALLSAAVGASVSGLSLHALMAAAAVVSLLAMADVLFVHPPATDAETGDERGRSAGSGRQRTG